MMQIVIEHNASLTRTVAYWVVFGMSMVMLILSAGFAYYGLWLVFPFAGLEILLLIVVFYRLLQCGQQKQVVSIGDEVVRIESGCQKPDKVCEFKRIWVSVVLEQPEIRGYPTRLYLRSSGKQVRIAEMLNGDDRYSLSKRLQKLIETGS